MIYGKRKSAFTMSITWKITFTLSYLIVGGGLASVTGPYSIPLTVIILFVVVIPCMFFAGWVARYLDYRNKS